MIIVIESENLQTGVSCNKIYEMTAAIFPTMTSKSFNANSIYTTDSFHIVNLCVIENLLSCHVEAAEGKSYNIKWCLHVKLGKNTNSIKHKSEF